ncbi:AmmeMemoRadiSam system radical SAM enzyme [bacterium]|nr:AmmeMemoRadiSam system radical SAM enzyme [bacterium]
MERNSRYYTKGPSDSVICQLCPLKCRITPDQMGVCRTRQNIQGELRLLNYGQISAINMDPIEKKPLYHFLPGSTVLSIGNKGCNLQCQFCQNWQISQTDVTTRYLSPEKLLQLVKDNKVPSVAFTYAEPMIWFEYILDCAKLLKKHDIKIILVSNGMINSDPFNELSQHIDALNIDIKSMNNDFYRTRCKGFLDPILETCRLAAKTCHLEITNLIITGENDSDNDFETLAKFISMELGSDTPLHLSRYYPSYKMKNPPTPVETIIRAGEIASRFLNYVYLGNLLHQTTNNTYCHNCNHLLVKREGYSVKIAALNKSNLCPKCNAITHILFS